MTNKKPVGAYAVLFAPWLLSLAVGAIPVMSYFVAWLGSFFIFYITLTGKLQPLPTDRSVAAQLMRPIFLVQIIFAGYMCTTSIFYFFNLLGYSNFQKTAGFFLTDDHKIMLTAQCQRYYCLAHASFVCGILFFMNYPVKPSYTVKTEKLAGLLLVMALITFPVATLFLKLPGLTQFYFQISSLSFISGTLALAFAIPLKKIANTIICIALYCVNFYAAMLSGFKEPIIISILVLGIFLYPSYKTLVTVTFVPIILSLFILLPIYNRAFRQNSWSGDADNGEASQIALDAVINRDADEDEGNWAFFVFRLSEIDMFTIFVESTPAHIDFYGLTLLEQSATALVPRLFWPSKPSTEQLIMGRVYDAGVVNRGSTVSAKPAFVVDAYLSWGTPGIFIFLFLYGATAQLISLKAEKLFGGYTLGTALIFSGLFQIMWRGISFEFIINSVFWSYISMLVIFKILKITGILKPV